MVTLDGHQHKRHAAGRRMQPSVGHLHESKLVYNKTVVMLSEFDACITRCSFADQ